MCFLEVIGFCCYDPVSTHLQVTYLDDLCDYVGRKDVHRTYAACEKLLQILDDKKLVRKTNRLMKKDKYQQIRELVYHILNVGRNFPSESDLADFMTKWCM